ncbi:hypothetical protein QQS21_012794 [Conoideocrella luteorostrata]|uniref:BTB domain-containing protein n=1 Tax=Conoideocrella luteorostrata TaxID=1105319 RepID=A0AAJ0FSD1_9HYPO|nr:hypothetical protein QQS21_012794 [Conoideocrella luteorostrata]
MLLPAKSVFSSPVITFTVGAAKTKFTLHSDAVANQSRILTDLMSECQKNGSACVNWEDVDEDTFVFFCQYLYDEQYVLKLDEKLDRMHHFELEKRMLGQARIYCFAHRYGVLELEDAAYAALQRLIPHPEVVQTLPRLLKFCWDTNAPPALHTLVFGRAITKSLDLEFTKEFSDLLDKYQGPEVSMLRDVAKGHKTKPKPRSAFDYD